MSDRNNEIKTWSMLCHISALLSFLFSWGGIIGPLLVWQLKRKELPEIDPHGKESLNFQITLFLVYFILGIIVAGSFGYGIFFRSPMSFFGGGIGLALLFPLLNIVSFILVIIATITANNGGFFKYPLSIRFIR